MKSGCIRVQINLQQAFQRFQKETEAIRQRINCLPSRQMSVVPERAPTHEVCGLSSCSLEKSQQSGIQTENIWSCDQAPLRQQPSLQQDAADSCMQQRIARTASCNDVTVLAGPDIVLLTHAPITAPYAGGHARCAACNPALLIADLSAPQALSRR